MEDLRVWHSFLESFNGRAGWIRQSVSEATWAAYSKVWQEWLALMQQLEMDQEGPEVRLLVLYFILRNLENEVSVSVLEKKLAGLAFLFKLKGCQDFTKDF